MVKAVMDCTGLSDFNNYKVVEDRVNSNGVVKQVFYMKSDWWLWDKLDEHNSKLAHFAKQLCVGLSDAFVASA